MIGTTSSSSSSCRRAGKATTTMLLSLLLLLICNVEAFTVLPQLPTTISSLQQTPFGMIQQRKQRDSTVQRFVAVAPNDDSTTTTSRKEFLSTMFASSMIVGGGLLQSPSPANAAKYGSFGADNSGVTMDPSMAEIDRDLLASKSVQDAISKIKTYQQSVRKMQQALQSDPQYNVRPILLKELDTAPLRTALNIVNEIFDEDTQRGTDRLIRGIVQDIYEVEIANTQKEGIERSPRRYDNVQAKITKLDQAFEDYLAFTK